MSEAVKVYADFEEYFHPATDFFVREGYRSAYKNVTFIRHWQPLLESYEVGKTYRLPTETADRALFAHAAVNAPLEEENAPHLNATHVALQMMQSDEGYSAMCGLRKALPEGIVLFAALCLLLYGGMFIAKNTAPTVGRVQVLAEVAPHKESTLYNGLRDFNQPQLAALAPQLVEGK